MLRLFFSLNTLVGTLFFAFLGTTGYYTIAHQKQFALQTPLHLLVRLDTAEGMRAGAPVLVQGVEMGLLRSLHYVRLDGDGNAIPHGTRGVQAADQMALAVLDLREKLPFYAGYKITTRYPSVISGKLISIDPGRSEGGAPPLPQSYLNTTELLSFQRTGELPGTFRKEAVPRAGNHDDPLYLVAKVITENRRNIRRITSNLRHTTDKINEGEGTVARILNEGDLVEGVDGVLAELSKVVTDARDGLEALRETDSMINTVSELVSLILSALLAGGG